MLPARELSVMSPVALVCPVVAMSPLAVTEKAAGVERLLAVTLPCAFNVTPLIA